MTPQRERRIAQAHGDRIAARKRFGDDADFFADGEAQLEQAHFERLVLRTVGYGQPGDNGAIAFFQLTQMTRQRGSLGHDDGYEQE